MCANRTHCELNVNPAISDRDRIPSEGIGKLTSTSTFLVGHMEKPGNTKCGRYCVQLSTAVRWISAAKRLKEPYRLKLLIAEARGPLLMIRKNCSPQTGTTAQSLAREIIRSAVSLYTGSRSARFEFHQKIRTTCSI